MSVLNPSKVRRRSLADVGSYSFGSRLADQYTTEWNVSAKTSDVLEEFQSFHPDLVATIA